MAKIKFLDWIPDFKAGKIVHLEAIETVKLPDGVEHIFEEPVYHGGNTNEVVLKNVRSQLDVDGLISVDLQTFMTTQSEVFEEQVTLEKVNDSTYLYGKQQIEIPRGAQVQGVQSNQVQLIVSYEHGEEEWTAVMDTGASGLVSYKDGYVFSSGLDSKVHLTPLSTFVTTVNDDCFYTNWVDTGEKKLITVARSHFEPPYDAWSLWYEEIFTYNGLLWHSYDDHVIPMVVDFDYLEEPGYRPDHIIQWSDRGTMLQGGKGMDNYFGSYSSPREVTDMSTFTNYRVTGADTDDLVFSGVLDGEFKFWKWTEETTAKMLEKLQGVEFGDVVEL